MRLGKTAVAHFTSQAIVSGAGFIATFVIARMLGAGTLGTYAVVVGILFWLSIPGNAINGAMVKRLTEGDRSGQYLAVGLFLNFILAGCVVTILIFLSKHLNQYFDADVTYLLAAIFLTRSIYSIASNLLTGEHRVAASGLLGAIERVFRTGAQAALLLIGYKIIGLLVGHAASLLIVAVVGLLLSDTRPAFPTRADIQSVIDYAQFSWISTIQSRMFGWMDTLILAVFVSSALIGVYEVAWTLSSFLAIAGASIRSTLFPRFSELDAKNDHETILNVLDDGLAFSTILILPGLFGVAVIGSDVLRIYGTEFSRGNSILLILTGAQVLKSFQTQFTDVINAVDRPDLAFWINLTFIITNLVLNIGLIWAFGWVGAAVATTLSAGVATVLGYLTVVRLVGSVPLPFGEFARQTIASVIMAGVVAALHTVVSSSHHMTVVIISAGTVCYFTLIMILSRRTRQKFLSLMPGRGSSLPTN